MVRTALRAFLPLLVLAMLLSTCGKKDASDETAAAGKSPATKAAMSPGGVQSKSRAFAESEAGGANPNAYYENTYAGGYGERERTAKLIENGVVVDGKEIHLAAFTREYGQSLSVPTDRALALTAETEVASVPSEGGTTFLQVGIQAIEREAPKRPPINLALVIDRSGSMGSESKLEYAKKAAEAAVNQLQPSDRVAVVTYDEAVRVDVPSTLASDKKRILGAIRGLSPGGSTNVYAGLEKGYAEVAPHASAEAVSSVILLSDGLITAGERSDAAFDKLVQARFEKGIQTTTIGLGLEYNDSLMARVARVGKGAYHFVRDAASVPEVMERELGDLQHVVAKAVRLRVLLAPGIELVRVLGSRSLDAGETAAAKSEEQGIDRKVYEDLGITPDRGKSDEPGVKMLIPHFYMGDSHVVLFEVRVPGGRQETKVADAWLEYKDVVFRRNGKESAACEIDHSRSREDMIASTNHAIRKNRLGYETGAALLEASRLIAGGNTAQAAKVVDERMAVLGVAAREWNDTDLERDHELLGRYVEVLKSAGGRTIANEDLGRYLSRSLTYSGSELTR